ncbi:MAG: hypothetical protein K0R49_132 [Burkholderiales bacterium]|jgi:hypothetical protein|nr:hypothetical protein [Burkholderiales bacterium]
MITFKQFIISCIIFSVTGCALWQQQSHTPSTFDSSLDSQRSLNIVLHSVSDALNSKLLSQDIDKQNHYVAVYALTLQNKPTAVSIFSTPSNNTYFTQALKSSDIAKTIFSNTNGVTHSDTTIVRVSYNEIRNQAARDYLTSAGFNDTNYFLQRTTRFYKNEETLKLIDYTLPDQKTNRFIQ